MTTPSLFWLHVPLETTRGDYLEVPFGGKLVVLGKPAVLCERPLHVPDSLTAATTAVVRQWLLFDPLPESDARALLEELRAKFPVLSLRQDAALRVGASDLHVASHHLYTGIIPTLIPAHLTPSPTWVDLQIRSHMDGRSTLGSILAGCPSVTDERILTALDLLVASRYDVLPRSIFLAQLTILDALAVRAERPPGIRAWLSEKIEEAKALQDGGLLSSLENLKLGSHGAAVRALVGRAAEAKGMSGEKQKALKSLAGKLYGVRSSLSHAGAGSDLDVQGAKNLARLVLDAAIEHPAVLDPAYGTRSV
ncbi:MULTISPECIES: hypothetical protein [Methylobacterium]|jgi:hypothetical protein|uniref:Apea-like HEPN domain-containing protein n=2 Tax=Methylobacterium TaxID=407 RepID=A0A2U8VT39_9HYPH|nr:MULTISPECIES: hypothetical protein [Methylobacterium]AWN36611.1 hypothetical protein DK427_13430 [Methylobacterium radiodurans]GJD55045.1 hypothetical protein IFDJLNFL_0927 [Methylobacterium dankookense]VUF12043.1 hypothetical protein MTDSW087_01731 [Methylobacterium dankookense]